MAAKDNYIKTLEAEIARNAAEREAMVQEFTSTLKDGNEVTAEGLRKSVDKLLPDALATMAELLSVAENDSLRWSIAKFIISSKLGEGKGAEGADVFKELLEEFTSK